MNKIPLLDEATRTAMIAAVSAIYSHDLLTHEGKLQLLESELKDANKHPQEIFVDPIFENLKNILLNRGREFLRGPYDFKRNYLLGYLEKIKTIDIRDNKHLFLVAKDYENELPWLTSTAPAQSTAVSPIRMPSVTAVPSRSPAQPSSAPAANGMTSNEVVSSVRQRAQASQEQIAALLASVDANVAWVDRNPSAPAAASTAYSERVTPRQVASSSQYARGHISPANAAAPSVASIPPRVEPLSSVISDLPPLTVQHDGRQPAAASSSTNRDGWRTFSAASTRGALKRSSSASSGLSQFLSIFNSEPVIERGERLGSISGTSENLAATSAEFLRAATKYRQRCDASEAASPTSIGDQVLEMIFPK